MFDRIKRFLWVISIFTVFSFSRSTVRAESGESVVVVYNSALDQSKAVAEHYAKVRDVPADQILGLELSTTETMGRSEFRNDLQKPLFKFLEKQKLWSVRLDSAPTTNAESAPMIWRVKESKIRYLVLCWGVPSRIVNDPDLREQVVDTLPEPLRRNDAAVDSELSLLPIMDLKRPISGLVQSPFYCLTNAADLNAVNGILMVARLDGPTPELARGLVDKAIEAERDGLWGRAYFDIRGVTNDFAIGDQWLRKAAEVAKVYGFETIVDEAPQTFSASFPMSQIGLYAGWYDENVSGPFSRSKVEFMPGAIAYHLHSFSASTIRDPDKRWVGPLIAKGATATFGYVEEPYLQFTMNVGAFMERLAFLKFSFGEAAYAAQPALSWQTTVIGDPLYRPFARNPQSLHQDLEARKSKMVEWSHLRVVNLNLNSAAPKNEIIKYLEDFGTNSAVLTEKLGDVQNAEGKTWSAINAYTQALDRNPSEQQELRLLLELGEKLKGAKQPAEALGVYKQLVRKFPTYPELAGIYKKMADLATQSGKTTEAETYLQKAR